MAPKPWVKVKTHVQTAYDAGARLAQGCGHWSLPETSEHDHIVTLLTLSERDAHNFLTPTAFWSAFNRGWAHRQVELLDAGM